MAFLVELSRRAERDLDEIYAYTCAELSSVALAWIEGLQAAILSLENYPARGAKTREQAELRQMELRQILYGQKPNVYRIIYRVDDTAKLVTIITIRYGARAPLRLR